jgi:hypothetical protein
VYELPAGPFTGTGFVTAPPFFAPAAAPVAVVPYPRPTAPSVPMSAVAMGFDSSFFSASSPSSITRRGA